MQHALTLGSGSCGLPVSPGQILSACSSAPPRERCHPLSLAGACRGYRELGFACISCSISGQGGGHPHPRPATPWCIQWATRHASLAPTPNPGTNTNVAIPLGVTRSPWVRVAGRWKGEMSGSISSPRPVTLVWWLAGGGPSSQWAACTCQVLGRTLGTCEDRQLPPK